MKHEDVLNMLLSNACGVFNECKVKELGFQEYFIELHCSNYRIHARSLGNGKYNILSCERYS